jgi:hypothetical protein
LRSYQAADVGKHALLQAYWHLTVTQRVCHCKWVSHNAADVPLQHCAQQFEETSERETSVHKLFAGHYQVPATDSCTKGTAGIAPEQVLAQP